MKKLILTLLISAQLFFGICSATEITHHQADSTAGYSTTSGTYVDVGNTITLNASTTYIIFANIQMGAGHALDIINARILIDGIEAVGSENSWSVQDQKKYQTMMYMQKHTTGGSTEIVKVQYKLTSGIGDNRIQTHSLIALSLDDLAASDWAFAEDNDTASPVQHTTSWADFASITFTPSNNNDDWLVFANMATVIDSTTVNYEMRINESVGSTLVPFATKEGGNTAATRMTTLSRVFTLSNASHTIKVQARDDATGINDHKRSAIFAVRLNAFKQHSFAWNEAPDNPPDGLWEEIHALSVTPDTTGNWVGLGTAVSDMVFGKLGQIRYQLDAVTKPANFDLEETAVAFDDTDEVDESVIAYFGSLTANTLYDIDVDHAGSKPTNETEDRSFVVFSLELAGGAAPTFQGQIY